MFHCLIFVGAPPHNLIKLVRLYAAISCIGVLEHFIQLLARAQEFKNNCPRRVGESGAEKDGEKTGATDRAADEVPSW